MSHSIYFENCLVPGTSCVTDISSLKQHILQEYGVPLTDFYVTINGKHVTENRELQRGGNVIRIYSRLVGGKGGFGSMLRAIGAQIEKTTNREACRDLSGRRLRDINEEKRLRKWLEGQADREKEAADRKLKKLERLVAEPKIDVDLKDSNYEKERQELPERVCAAVDAGLQASKSNLKRKADDDKLKFKKKKLWIDADLSECSSSDEDKEDASTSSTTPSHSAEESQKKL